jgi:ribosomal protein S18 acetylase RimI-like enzyme
MNPARTIRSAALTDHHLLARLIGRTLNVHRHLDWREPLHWIGASPFLVLEGQGELRAALACPPDPPGVAWLRLYVNDGRLSDWEAWSTLWEAARRELASLPGVTAAAIVLRDWISPYLERSGFTSRQQIVMLKCDHPDHLLENEADSFLIRPMLSYDLPAVADVDASAFGLLWQNSLPSLSFAYQQASIATVAESENRIIGYQISTRTSLGIHLARLAVLPQAQGRGVGYALTADMMRQGRKRGVECFTVNTQSDNPTSLTLYKRIGFRETGERYPVYQCRVS